MNQKRIQPDEFAELRQRAEETAWTEEAKTHVAMSPEEAGCLLHELQVHQIELEMQNEELRRAQRELEASRARYFDLYELAPVGYFTLSEQGLIQEANLTGAGLLGLGRNVLVMQPFTRFIFPEDQDIYYRHRKQLFKSGSPQAYDLRMLRADTAPFWARLETTRYQDGESGVPRCRMVVLDISKPVHDKKQIELLREELSHATRLAVMGELASGIAHEINQPLAIIKTWIEVAMREISNNLTGNKEETLLALKRIDAAIERSACIVQRMKNFSRKSSPQITEFSLSAAVGEVFPFIEQQVKIAEITMTIDIDPAIPPVIADKTQVHQVLLNLFMNAIEALNNAVPAFRRLAIRAKANDCFAEVAVSDSGCGIPLEKLGNIFFPFYSTKPEGAGLGLSICQTIVQQLGGRIWATCNADCGSTITFTLPIAKENASQPPHAKGNSCLHRKSNINKDRQDHESKTDSTR
jgi:PAS domain S-box-containing protein